MAKKKVVEPTRPVQYGIVYEQTGGDYYHDGEQYGDWRSDAGHTEVKYITEDDKGSRHARTFNGITLTKGEMYFFVYVIYGSGDTFGHSSGNFESILILDKKEDAHELAKLIRSNYDDRSKKDEYSFDFKGNRIYAGSWKGYFESLSSVEVAYIPYGEEGQLKCSY